MQLKEFSFNIDIKETITIAEITVVQGDNSDVFNIALTDGTNKYDLSDTTAMISFKKPDATIVLQEATIVDAENGLITYNLDMQVTAIPGAVSAEIIVLGPNEEKLTSGYFIFNVRNPVTNETEITSSDLFSALANALADVENFKTTIPRGVIYDTDWGSDVDDVVAARVLLWAERMGYVDIVAIVTSVAQDNTSPSLDAYFQEEGRPGLLIGVDKTSGTGYNITPTYQTEMISTHEHTWDDIASMEDSTSIYRRAFANADKPIDIVVVGFLNCIENFMKSSADSISPLTGMELIQQNGGTLWTMGGGYPDEVEDTYNYGNDSVSKASAEYVINNWPNEIVFSALGSEIWTGWTIGEDSWWLSFDILAQSLNAHGSGGGRPSWDPLLMWVACMNDFDMCGVNARQGVATYDASTGTPTWTDSTEGNHYALEQLHADKWYERELNSIIERIAWPHRSLGTQQLSEWNMDIPAQSSLVLSIDGEDFLNDPPTTVLDDRSDTENDLDAINFAYESWSGADGNGGIRFHVDSDTLLKKDIPVSLPTADNPRSVAFNIELTTSSYAGIIISWGDHSISGDGFAVEIGDDDSENLKVVVENNTWTTNYNITYGVKTHICVTYDGTNTMLYVNGVLQDQATSQSGIATSGVPLVVGAKTLTNINKFGYNSLYDARIYDKALNSQEVLDDYTFYALYS